MDMNELLLLAEPEIKELEFFYTNLVKERLNVVAGEFSDNEKERKATEEVIDSVHAVITLDPPTVKLVYECKNEPWLEIMDEGMPAPAVTGGTAHNPDNTTYQSKAAVTGGTYTAGAEAPSYALREALDMAKGFMAEDVKAIISSNTLIREKIKEYVVDKIQTTIRGDAS